MKCICGEDFEPRQGKGGKPQRFCSERCANRVRQQRNRDKVRLIDSVTIDADAIANSILHGDALEVLKRLPDECVQMVCSSPPYYALRSYLPDGHPEKKLEVGSEETPERYIKRLVAVFREVRRVTRDDGVLWLNLGDSYAGGKRGRDDSGPLGKFAGTRLVPKDNPIPAGLKSKDLMMMPACVAIALRNDGWYLRSSCIWHKTNAMPSSVTDRPSNDYEYVFLLSKSERYFYDGEAIKEPAQDWGIRERGMGKYQQEDIPPIAGPPHRGLSDANYAVSGRNKRAVWSIPTSAYPGSHFAVMPPELVEVCLLSGSSPRACELCGAPYRRVVERFPMVIKSGPKSGGYGSRTTDGLSGTMVEPASSRTVGWEATCKCKNADGTGRCLVLDPFMGAGTVALVSRQHGRDYVGIELNAEYIKLAEKRLAVVPQRLWSMEGA